MAGCFLLKKGREVFKTSYTQKGSDSVSKRTAANFVEQSLGVQGATKAFAQDMFTNAAARMGFGTPSLGQGAEYTLVRISYDYWQLITLFRNHWVSRRIVEVPAQDMVKAWPRLTSDIDPKDLTRIDRALRKTNTKNNFQTGMTWGRLFGGAGGLMVIDGQEDELDQPLDIESVGIGAYKGIIPFDRWAGISPMGDVCTDINRPLDFNKPEMYEVRVNGGDAFKVHSSRLLRFTGPMVPTPELEAQSQWGISVLEPAYESITKLDNMSWNILSLTFRANLLGMKFPELAQLLSGLGSSQIASQKFEGRMSAINHLMSNNSLIPLPADGGIEATSYSFGGLSDVFQLFQLDLAGAAQMPITRLFGRTYNGLGQAGDGDERIYEEKIATDQATYMVPQLEKLYPVICMSELGEVPDDLDLVCPSIRVLDEKDKSELAKATADTVTVYMNGGIMSPRVAAMEVKQSSAITGIGTNLTPEFIATLSDEVQSEGELGEGLFGEAGGLEAASGPGKAIREENAKAKGASGSEPKDKADSKKAEPEDQDEAKKETLKKAGKVKDSAPDMPDLLDGIAVGEKVLVHGHLLTVAGVLPQMTDLFDEEVVPVQFTDGSVVAYRARATDSYTVRDSVKSLLRRHMSGKESLPKDAFFDECMNFLSTSVAKNSAVSAEVERMESVFTLKRLCANVQTELRRGRATDEDGASSVTKSAQEFTEYHAMPVRVETPAGGARAGVLNDGTTWSTNMPADYGFIEGVPGADGDSLDCYIGLSPESSNVYVVDQYDLNGRVFDETKVMLGYATRESALEDYMLGHHLSRKTFAAITPFTMPLFRRWLATHDMKQPCDPGVKTQS